jgi:hypothetical protein
MTGWFDPGVLARTAVMLATANVFGRHSDRRLIEALGSQPQSSFDYPGESGEDFWLDYVSDVGDGWNSTYAVAEALGRAELVLESAEGGIEHTPGGRVLVLGGDLVYPYPTRDAYATHTEVPYAAALSARAARPDLFAIPGNHDWYDSLIAFSRSFCRPERGFAGCRTPQSRSYFALKLPHDWWLCGVDLQLGADFDEPQIQYFQSIGRAMGPQAQVILCVPEPQWIYAVAYPRHASYQARTLEYLEREVLKRPVRLFLTGDLHHYKRHTRADGAHRIVCGGGGAFLHPTQCPDVPTLNDGAVEQCAYPPKSVSAGLALRNLLFPVLNPRAAVLPAIVYALSAWFVSARLDVGDLSTFGHGLQRALATAVQDPFCGLWLLAVVAGLVFFTDTHSRPYRILGGGLHAVAHLVAAFCLAWLASRLTMSWLGLAYGTPLQLVVAGALTFVGGAVVGPLIVGLYLLASVALFGRHYQEAYSSLRIEDFKCWLRLRIGRDGLLTAWVVGHDRVPRRWSAQARPSPADARASAPRVVDRFTVRPRS